MNPGDFTSSSECIVLLVLLLTKHTSPHPPQLPLASVFPSSSAQVSVVQAGVATELHRQDEESGQLSSISVRHMTAKAPPPLPTYQHITHTCSQAKEKYKEWGCVALLIVQRHRNCLSVSPSLCYPHFLNAFFCSLTTTFACRLPKSRQLWGGK